MKSAMRAEEETKVANCHVSASLNKSFLPSSPGKLKFALARLDDFNPNSKLQRQGVKRGKDCWRSISQKGRQKNKFQE